MNTLEETALCLRLQMKRRNWGVSELSLRARMPMGSIHNYLRAQSMPPPRALRRLADALGVKPAAIAPSYCAEMQRTLFGVNDNV